MDFNIQIHNNEAWETSKPRIMEFETRAEAGKFCRALATFCGKMVRLSIGTNYAYANGDYFPPHWSVEDDQIQAIHKQLADIFKAD